MFSFWRVGGLNSKWFKLSKQQNTFSFIVHCSFLCYFQLRPTKLCSFFTGCKALPHDKQNMRVTGPLLPLSISLLLCDFDVLTRNVTAISVKHTSAAPSLHLYHLRTYLVRLFTKSYCHATKAMIELLALILVVLLLDTAELVICSRL